MFAILSPPNLEREMGVTPASMQDRWPRVLPLGLVWRVCLVDVGYGDLPVVWIVFVWQSCMACDI